jgi:hypothetical protein
MNESSFSSASVLRTGTHKEAWIISTLRNIGPALHLSVLGILLILFFLNRLGLGIAVLPLSLEKHKDRDSDEDGAWKRIQIFIWISIVGISVLGFALGVSLLAAYRVILRFLDYQALSENL